MKPSAHTLRPEKSIVEYTPLKGVVVTTVRTIARDLTISVVNVCEKAEVEVEVYTSDVPRRDGQGPVLGERATRLRARASRPYRTAGSDALAGRGDRSHRVFVR